MKTKNILLDKKKLEDVIYYMPQQNNLRELADFFSMFSDETRLKIISALSMSEMCVGDISKILNLNQTTVSHQLKLLKSYGTVKYRREGKIIYYSLSNKMINECLNSGVDCLQNISYWYILSMFYIDLIIKSIFHCFCF